MSYECCSAGCDIFGPVSQCCLPEGQVCDYSRPTHANQYSCCYPLSCDPYKKSGITVCQEQLSRYPDSGNRANDGSDQKVIRVPWYSALNPLFSSKKEDGSELDFDDENEVPDQGAAADATPRPEPKQTNTQ